MFHGGLKMNTFKLDSDIDVSEPKYSVRLLSRNNYRYPNIVDYKDFCCPTDDQGTLPHCVGYGVAANLEVEYWKKYHYPIQFPASRIYHFGREFKADSPAGTRIEYCLQALLDKKLISCNMEYISRDNGLANNIKQQLHSYGVFISTFRITNEWYSWDRKFVIKEKKKPKQLGGHCVLVCGYNTTGIEIQNSWGHQRWGNYGFATLPWNLVEKQFAYAIGLRNLEFVDLEWLN